MGIFIGLSLLPFLKRDEDSSIYYINPLKIKKMKTIVIIISAVIFSFILASCGSKSGHLIGSFEVIKKVPQKDLRPELEFGQANDFGVVYLVSTRNDTLKIYVSSNESYLNIKVGDTYLVSKDKSGITINNHTKRFIIGYCKISEKISKRGDYEFKVVSRGEDTITIKQVPEIVYFNTSLNDSVFVKKNRSLQSYYTE